ncbi:hypothetical protein JMJ77_0012438 [Colletotrichum scovillei]|uniref:Uncharacterized protein n=1 Tax=Colletotrichum scovillei TaxID=1209932 RepID=A0A9P7UBX7_9PEZI|nr:hypothetical protein JMJ78_0001470 [Colletotrichum scovillei]KAG7041922.1 hypothetical protein JMJ77_0012438 [Colletotrichum scovillei]KAG7061954.1 hypothetical protein JMJ76_0003908 [Colletotrichum scovillei]
MLSSDQMKSELFSHNQESLGALPESFPLPSRPLIVAKTRRRLTTKSDPMGLLISRDQALHVHT